MTINKELNLGGRQEEGALDESVREMEENRQKNKAPKTKEQREMERAKRHVEALKNTEKDLAKLKLFGNNIHFPLFFPPRCFAPHSSLCTHDRRV